MMEIVVCDDDKNDLDNAVNMLHDIFEQQDMTYKIRAFSSANELLRIRQKIDIAVLDIAMDEVNGIRLGRELKEKFPAVKLIYTTSYEEYCIQAINEVHAFSFLCKPLDNEKLKVQIAEVLESIPDTGTEKEFYKVKDSKNQEYASITLKLEDILYFEYIKRSRKVEIVLAEEIYEYECIFEKLVEELQQYDFVVNCRGFLVNLSHIERCKGFSIYLDNGKEIPIAQKRIAEFRNRMNEFLQQHS